MENLIIQLFVDKNLIYDHQGEWIVLRILKDILLELRPELILYGIYNFGKNVYKPEFIEINIIISL